MDRDLIVQVCDEASKKVYEEMIDDLDIKMASMIDSLGDPQNVTSSELSARLSALIASFSVNFSTKYTTTVLTSLFSEQK